MRWSRSGSSAGGRSEQPPNPSPPDRVAANPDLCGRTTSRARSQDLAWALVFGSWLIATASALGALFFSEVMNLPPCLLCWYQRMFMFPLVLLLPVGMFPFDPKVVRYALPLSAVGWAIALFHVLLTYGVIPESIRPCTLGVPCALNQIEWFGFVSIPLLSLVAFTVINALFLLARHKVSKCTILQVSSSRRRTAVTGRRDP